MRDKTHMPKEAKQSIADPEVQFEEVKRIEYFLRRKRKPRG